MIFSIPFSVHVDAAIVGQLKLVKMLVERGADPLFKNRKGKTPVEVAASAVYSFLETAACKWRLKLKINFKLNPTSASVWQNRNDQKELPIRMLYVQ